MKTIKGCWDTGEVTINGKLLDPAESLRVYNHSPTGFSWGYRGSGPAQLALALLMAMGITPNGAKGLYMEFKEEVIAKLPQKDFEMTDIDIFKWLQRRNGEIKSMTACAIERGECANCGYIADPDDDDQCMTTHGRMVIIFYRGRKQPLTNVRGFVDPADVTAVKCPRCRGKILKEVKECAGGSS